jgi:predicted enzyme related to lactoylglutathione lyase
MDGKLVMLYVPVRDVQSAASFYHEQLGLQEESREGATTIILRLPGTDVKLMVDQRAPHTSATPGPLFLLPSVDAYYEQQQGKVAFLHPPVSVPGGRWVAAQDPSGNVLYFLDASAKQE